ncbi:MAG: hypothetical protein ACRDNK_02620 [Solirubrobacteraceae bacterium]
MTVEIAESARRHGVGDDQIRFVIEHCGLAFDQPAPDDSRGESRLVFLGDDSHGVALEVVAVANQTGDLRVIHAMKLRATYQREYEEAVPWRKLSSS